MYLQNWEEESSPGGPAFLCAAVAGAGAKVWGGAHLHEGRARRSGGGVERGPANPAGERGVGRHPLPFFHPPAPVSNFRSGWGYVTFPGPIAIQGSCDWSERIPGRDGRAPATVCHELRSPGSAPLLARPRPLGCGPRVLLAGCVGRCHCSLAGLVPRYQWPLLDPRSWPQTQ